MQKLKKAEKSIDNVTSDIKAEVVVADMLEQGIGYNDVIVHHNSAFDRNYKKDVTEIKLNTANKTISLFVNRNGLYDALPEGLFHPVTRYGSLDAQDRKKEFKVQQEEVAKARKFFLPLDNEFLLTKVKLEAEMRKLFHDPWASLDKVFNLNRRIPADYQRRFKKFLPYSTNIKGNIELTAFCLSEIIQDKVTIRTSFNNEKHQDDSLSLVALGNCQTGENFVCGPGFYDEVKVWEFIIELEDDIGIEKYVDRESGFMDTLFRKYCDYFVPFEIETKYRVECDAARELLLEDDESQIKTAHTATSVFLGYNTTI